MIVKLYEENPNPRHIQQIANCLSDGGLVIVPTDTVYAIVCSLNHVESIEAIAHIRNKKIKEANFSIICHNISQISDIVKPLSQNIFKLIKKNLPGPFTFILPANNKLAKILKFGRENVGIRIPDNNITLEIARTLGAPLITASVKNDDDIIEYITDPELIHEQYGDTVDIVVDGGIGNNEGSTIIDCTGSEPEIVRQGIKDVEY